MLFTSVNTLYGFEKEEKDKLADIRSPFVTLIDIHY